MATATLVSNERPLLLASGSPRRSELLRSAGIPLLVRPQDVDESQLLDEAAQAYVERICALKMASAQGCRDPLTPAILVADTTVALGREILGKPRDEAESLAMVASLVGRTHEVMTAYAVRSLVDGREVSRTITTKVVMRRASTEELRRYVATGEGLDKAGAYAIQGKGAALVARIDGSYTNVVGLPLSEVVADLFDLGLLSKIW